MLEVGPYPEDGLVSEINRFFGTSLEGMVRVNTYLMSHDEQITFPESITTGAPFVNPVVRQGSLGTSLASSLGLDGYSQFVASFLNPGTSDMDGNIALRQAHLNIGATQSDDDKGFLIKQHFLKGNISEQDLGRISRFLANEDLNQIISGSMERYQEGIAVPAPIVMLEKKEDPVRRYPITEMGIEDLLAMNTRHKLAASKEELLQFKEMYSDPAFLQARENAGLKNEATDVEAYVWFGLRSEHCFHKDLNAIATIEDTVDDPVFMRAAEKGWLEKTGDGLYLMNDGMFKKLIAEPAKAFERRLDKRGKNWMVSMFEDNSGVVLYDEDNMFCIKFETHNSPSNKEPINGAKTGIDGVNRDIWGTLLGSMEAIANFFTYCVGDPAHALWLPKGVKHPYVILKGITQGVREGGNESQIPTLGGGIIVDPRYFAKSLVFAGTVGFSPVRGPDGRTYVGKNHEVGDRILVVGQRVGIDGIGGATESSASFSQTISLGHVQADESYIQKKMSEFWLKAAREFLFSGVTDCGAMGISSVYEMARKTGGCEADLSKHPKKYEGILPYQVTASESQDRMVAAVRPKDLDRVKEHSKLFETEATDLGRFTDSGYIQLTWEGKTVALLDIEKLFDKEPRKRNRGLWDKARVEEPLVTKEKRSIEDSLTHVMQGYDVASPEWFFRQKDYSVKVGTIFGPLLGRKQDVGADATLQKPLETEGKDFGAIAYALGISPKLSDIDPYLSAQKSFVDMVGKIIALGGALPDMTAPKWDAWAVCGNYCQPNCEPTEVLDADEAKRNFASIMREGIGIREAMEALDVYVTSGKDSMKTTGKFEVPQEFSLEWMPPDLQDHVKLHEKDGKRFIEVHDPDTYLASCAVKIEDYRKCVTQEFKEEGDLIYVLGERKSALGGSQYAQAIGKTEQGKPYPGGAPPHIDLPLFRSLCETVSTLVNQEMLASSSYIHEGGLGAALLKSAWSGEIGAAIDLRSKGDVMNDEEVLFSQHPQFMVSIAREDKERFEEQVSGIPYWRLGSVTKDQTLSVTSKDGISEEIRLGKIKEAWQGPLGFWREG